MTLGNSISVEVHHSCIYHVKTSSEMAPKGGTDDSLASDYGREVRTEITQLVRDRSGLKLPSQIWCFSAHWTPPFLTYRIPSCAFNRSSDRRKANPQKVGLPGITSRCQGRTPSALITGLPPLEEESDSAWLPILFELLTIE